jgi:anti-sigma-K factor RskA
VATQDRVVSFAVTVLQLLWTQVGFEFYSLWHNALLYTRTWYEMPARSSGGWRLWVSAAALVVVVVLGIGILRAILGDSPNAVLLTSTAVAPEAGGQVRVEEEGENFQVELEVWKMPDLEEDEYYEMWYYAEDGDRISCGAFRTGPDNREPHGPCYREGLPRDRDHTRARRRKP